MEKQISPATNPYIDGGYGDGYPHGWTPQTWATELMRRAALMEGQERMVFSARSGDKTARDFIRWAGKLAERHGFSLNVEP